MSYSKDCPCGSCRATRHLMEPLLRRRVVTTNEAEREQCCGLDRDDDGFCVHRHGHPIFINIGSLS